MSMNRPMLTPLSMSARMNNIHYYFCDHQGNTRVVANGSGAVKQVNEYYPSGVSWGDASTYQGFQKFKYNGRSALGDASHLKKELDRMHGLFLYDYGARRYDPAVGPFLSPDPFVQTLDNPQNFNRYSYCLNNPLKYTDPSGELFIIDDWIWGGIKGLLTGHNFFRSANQHAENSFNIWKGLLSLDSNKSFWGRAWEMVSRFTWQGFQTELGFLAAHGFNTFGAVEKVESRYGVTVLTTKNMPGTSAFTLGNYIVGNRHTEADPNNSTFQHEYGHYLQSQSMGPFYVPLVAVPSFTSAVIAKDGNHRFSSYERDANYRAFMYFNKYVEGFYINEKSYYAWDRDKSKGWHLAENPLLPREYNKRYIDYLNPEDINRIKKYIGHFYNFWHF